MSPLIQNNPDALRQARWFVERARKYEKSITTRIRTNPPDNVEYEGVYYDKREIFKRRKGLVMYRKALAIYRQRGLINKAFGVELRLASHHWFWAISTDVYSPSTERGRRMAKALERRVRRMFEDYAPQVSSLRLARAYQALAGELWVFERDERDEEALELFERAAQLIRRASPYDKRIFWELDQRGEILLSKGFVQEGHAAIHIRDRLLKEHDERRTKARMEDLPLFISMNREMHLKP